MSSEVMTHPTWKRLHVALLVSDMVKSMIRLSRLGRSIFPINWPPGRERRNPALALRFRSMAGADSHVASKMQDLLRCSVRTSGKEADSSFGPHRLELCHREARDRVEVEGADLGRFLMVDSVRTRFAARSKHARNSGLRPIRN